MTEDFGKAREYECAVCRVHYLKPLRAEAPFCVKCDSPMVTYTIIDRRVWMAEQFEAINQKRRDAGIEESEALNQWIRSRKEYPSSEE